MYVENLESGFYDFVTGKRLVLIVSYDVDGICTCKMLQSLFSQKQVTYSLSVIRYVDELKPAYDEYRNYVKLFVLVNCGSTIDLIELLDPDDDSILFVIDSHRPSDVHNIYSSGQIRLMNKLEDEGDVPGFDAIFREESDEENEDDNISAESEGEETERNVEDDDHDDNEPEVEGSATKRRRLNEADILRRREKRQWEVNREKMLFEYSEFSYYSTPSAFIIFKLAVQTDSDCYTTLWLATVALTEHLMLLKMDNTEYVACYTQVELRRNQLQGKDADQAAKSAGTLNILFERDIKLCVYRHWSVHDSLKYSQLTACLLKLWSHQGDKRLHALLVDIGLPLLQSNQLFGSMDMMFRNEFIGQLEGVMEKYNLQDLFFPSCIIQYGYRKRYAACDFVYALIVLLEYYARDKSASEIANEILDCLGSSSKELLDTAVEKVKTVARTIFQCTKSAIDMLQIHTAGPFAYYIMQESSCPDGNLFSQQHLMLLFAHFLHAAYLSISRNPKATKLPFIVSTPYNVDKGTCLVLGVPPQSDKCYKSFLGKAFVNAAEQINCEYDCNFFDPSYIEIFVRDRSRFFDSLTVLLS